MLSPLASPFLRHITRCQNISFPAGRIPLSYQDSLIGWMSPELLPNLEQNIPHTLLQKENTSYILKNSTKLRTLSHILSEKKCFVPFNEWFDVRTPHGTPIGQIDRGLIPLLGIEAYGVHMNGIVHKDNTPHLWVARRSAHKRLDPHKLDHLVAGGMSSGLTPDQTLIKEANEEAYIPPSLSQNSHHVSTIQYAMLRPEGLRRDKVYCYDLILPEDFTPHAQDGEVESFQLLSLQDVFTLVRDTDHFKFNVNLVLIDLFIRYDLFSKKDATMLLKQLHSSSSH